MEKIYVIGHLNPDTDSAVAALSMAEFLNARDRMIRFTPAMTGKANSETEYIFNKFKLNLPEIVENADGKKLFLVDHNEGSQIVHGWKIENILGFVDHHKIKFECPAPVEVYVKPWGSSNSVVYDLFKKEHLPIPKGVKQAMLSAILSDTVILKSPTTTPMDMHIVEELSSELKLDFHSLGMEIFKAKAKIAEKSASEILKNDYKDFDFKGKKFGIGQIELPDLNEISAKIPAILHEMETVKKEGGYNTILLMLTDIIQGGSKLAIVSDDLRKIEEIFNIKVKNNVSEFIPSMMSRKKQVASVLAEKI